MSPISRRDVLKGGVAGGVVAASGLALGHHADSHAVQRLLSAPVATRQPDSLPYPTLPAGTESMPEIKHIIVAMQENHSYDNYLGMLGRGAGQAPRGDGFTIGSNGLPTNSNPQANGTPLQAFLMPTTCQEDAKPSQEWQASHVQYADGALDGFVVSASGPVAMGYWTGDDLPFYYDLANTFPLGDRYFCSLLGQTWPNRRFLIAATSAGMVDDTTSELTTSAPNGTIFDRLDQYGISWRDYYHTDSSPTTGVYLSDPANQSPNVVSIDAFFTDAAAGTLPSFAIVDPNFDTGSEEDPQDIVVGEAFVAQVVNALMNSPAWENTLLIWTYDEHGGYYDHVAPPLALAPDQIAPIVPTGEVAYNGFSQYGFRVPAVVVSPYSKQNYVSHLVYDHTSILATVEAKWNLPAMTYRDANALDLTDFLDFANPGFMEPPTLAAPKEWPAACEATGPGLIPPTA